MSHSSLTSKPTSALNQQGQIGVIILLIMVVVLTIGLSLASRTTQEIFISQQFADSTRVFNAAESGVEQALSSSFDFQGVRSAGSIDNFSGTDIDVAYEVNKSNSLEMRLFEMVSVELDVRGVATGNQIRIEWSRENDCATENVASIIAAIHYDVAGTKRVRYQSIAGCNYSENFATASTINENGYRRRYDLNLTTGDQFVRIMPIYNDTHLKVAGQGWTMPVQSYLIRSEANNVNGNESRAVSVTQSRDAAPAVFDFAVYSGAQLSK